MDTLLSKENQWCFQNISLVFETLDFSVFEFFFFFDLCNKLCLKKTCFFDECDLPISKKEQNHFANVTRIPWFYYIKSGRGFRSYVIGVGLFGLVVMRTFHNACKLKTLSYGLGVFRKPILINSSFWGLF